MLVCESRAYNLKLVCLLFDGELTEDDFDYFYDYGIKVNCNGNKLDSKRIYESNNLQYLGCCLEDGSSYHECQVYSLSFPIWAIISIVLVATLFVGGFSFLYYKRIYSKKKISTNAPLL